MVMNDQVNDNGDLGCNPPHVIREGKSYHHILIILMTPVIEKPEQRTSSTSSSVQDIHPDISL
jgi:hypothetical protein